MVEAAIYAEPRQLPEPRLQQLPGLRGRQRDELLPHLGKWARALHNERLAIALAVANLEPSNINVLFKSGMRFIIHGATLSE